MENYEQMLKRIARVGAITMVICLFFLEHYLSFFDVVLKEFKNYKDYQFEVHGLLVGIPYIIAALIWYLLSYNFHIHDRLSDLFKIRKNFDVLHIMIPMRDSLGLSTTNAQKEKLYKKRSEIMSKTFYKYADSTVTDSQTNISAHLIRKALSNWTKFWAIMESQIIILITTLILFFNDKTFPGIIFLLVFLVFILFQLYFYTLAIKYAKSEVEAILDLSEAISKEIRRVMNAL